MPELNRDGLSPTVARIGRILHPQTRELRWAVFIASGRMAKMHHFPEVTLVDIENGHIIQKIILDGAADMKADEFLSNREVDFNKGEILSGQPAIIDSDNNGIIDRIYLASSRGLIHKINLPDDVQHAEMEITNCILNTDFIDYNSRSVPMELRWQPFYASPAVLLDNRVTDSGDKAPLIRVFIGTDGSNSKRADIEDKWNQETFFSYIDTNLKGMCLQENHHLEWFVELDEGHRITTSAFGAADRVYFGTNASSNLYSCAANGSTEEEKGKLYVFDFEGVEVMSNRIGNVQINPLVTDEHIYLMLPSGLLSIGSGIYNNILKSFTEPIVTVSAWEEVK